MTHPTSNDDIDPQETREWLESLESVLEREGPERAQFLLETLTDKARRTGSYLPFSANTAYLNTIPLHREPQAPGDPKLEERINSYIRWNALVTVLRSNQNASDLGGHIASFASAATLYDIGFNHFFHARTAQHGGDLVYFQGHSAPGIYARAFLEGRISEAQIDRFRQEVDGGGLSSYPHPWLMPDFWQFPTVSMGLGPIMAIYQARFMKYLESRGLSTDTGRKVWCFCGDGEMDEPESLGAISLAGREKLDNLIFVINCNLQRLDGPVRGNGKIIQELEGAFRGAGWNAIKVIWGGQWDALLAQDHHGLLKKRMEECVDGDYQTMKAKDGQYVREHFFGKYPALADMVAHLSNEDIWKLNRGGHDPHKVYAAYAEAVHQPRGRPTVILAKTIKGYGMGRAGEAQNITHQQKKMNADALREFRDRFQIPIADADLANLPLYKPAEDSAEMQYMRARRAELGGYLPTRQPVHETLPVPTLSAFERLLHPAPDREFSTTMAFVQILGILVKDKTIGSHIVPIVPDESRTFGMEGMFRQLGIWSSTGQLYVPQDSEQLMFYKEDARGQILQEGISEAGGMSDWIAAATSYANHGVSMIPFFIYYSMFGFQRTGDLAWAAGDMRARGFLLGGTAGRTTLNGEGLQHQDGHSHVFAGFIPNCVSYDPTFAFEVAVIIQDGLRRMVANHEDVYFYITLMNENYPHLPMPAGVEQAILKGLYLLRAAPDSEHPRVQLLGSGTILREALAAADLLFNDWGVLADVWSVPSFNELKRDADATNRWNRLHPHDTPKISYANTQLSTQTGPFVAATDYIRSYAEQIRAEVPGQYIVLGTDGFGRSDTRAQLRRFFEVDRFSIVVAALSGLVNEQKLSPECVSKAMHSYQIDPEKPIPTRV